MAKTYIFGDQGPLSAPHLPQTVQRPNKWGEEQPRPFSKVPITEGCGRFYIVKFVRQQVDMNGIEKGTHPVDGETPTMDVALWATLDDQAAAPRGDLLVHWFRTAMDRLFPAGVEESAASWVLVTESMAGGREPAPPLVRTAAWGRVGGVGDRRGVERPRGRELPL